VAEEQQHIAGWTHRDREIDKFACVFDHAFVFDASTAPGQKPTAPRARWIADMSWDMS